jgi:hypothetical protein
MSYTAVNNNDSTLKTSPGESRGWFFMPHSLIVRLERVMQLWLSNTPSWMQPKLFWTAYFFLIDNWYKEQRHAKG